jgi:hypothetical protein
MPADVRLERKTRPGQGVDRWITEARNNKRPFIKVGILSGTGEHPKGTNGQTLAEVGWWNEFGTKTIPERPFLRTGLREKITKYRMILNAGLKKILVGATSVDQVLGILGVAAVADVQMKIIMIQSPPNAPATVAQKGSSSPLQDTGALRQHISWAIVEGPG